MTTNNEAKITGIIRISRKGIGFIFDENTNSTVNIEPAFLHNALHGDEVEILKHPAMGEMQTGEVTNIITRKKLGFTGTLEKMEDSYILAADDARMYAQIVIEKSSLPTDPEKIVGQKILAEIVNWPNDQKNPTGELVEVLGKPGTHEVEMQSIVLDKGLPIRFPDAVEKAAEEIRQSAKNHIEDEAKNRQDFRGIKTFTIDPADAKDFDDALSIKNLDDEYFEIGVHIADVSHYVKPGSILDIEARRRATSIYLVDRTIPMLPEALSNDICSLIPETDRLAFSAVFEINKKGEIRKEWFGRTIINSDKRFAYEDVQEIIEDKVESEHKDSLINLRDVARALREDKIKAGAVSFDDTEVNFKLDSEGAPLEIYLKDRFEAHLLIEDFMLLANKKVAEFAYGKNKGSDNSFVYRIHDYPDFEKITKLKTFLEPMGYKLQIDNEEIKSTELNRLLTKAEGTTEETIIQKAAVRSMSKAIYSTKNIGHWGLAFKYYTHFTSPIRRYPDVLVHRLLNIYIHDKKPDEKTIKSLASDVIHSSNMEQKATEAERESIRYKQIEYMQDKVGQVFSGIISGVAEWGIFIEEKTTKTDGLVRLGTLKSDYYDYDDKKFAIVGRRTGTKYQLGDQVRVKLTGTDLKARQVDYELV